MARIDTRPPSSTPKVAEAALRIYGEGQLKFTDAGLDQITQLLDADSADHNALFWGLVGLWSLAQIIIQERGDNASGERLMIHVKSLQDRWPAFEEEVRTMTGDHNDSVAQSFLRSVGDRSAKKAPVVGSAAPKGSTKLSDLIPQASLRPPMPKKK